MHQPPAPEDRLQWADVAKGVSILLVVLHHLLPRHYRPLGWDVDLPADQAWELLNSAFFQPIRMPLFFAISGMFATAALRRSWREVAIKRIVPLSYLYALWICLSALIYVLIRSDTDFLLLDSPWQLVETLWAPTSNLWYLYALVVCCVVAKATGYVSTSLLLPMAAVVSAVSQESWLVLPGMWEGILGNLVFFLIGSRMSSLMKAAASKQRLLFYAIPTIGYAGVVTTRVFGLDNVYGMEVLAGLAGLWFGISLAAMLSKVRWLSPTLTYLGRRTLPIFVLHGPLLAIIRWLADGSGAHLWVPILQSGLVAFCYPAAAVIILIALSLAIYTIASKCGGSWLFNLPCRAGPMQPSRLATQMARETPD